MSYVLGEDPLAEAAFAYRDAAARRDAARRIWEREVAETGKMRALLTGLIRQAARSGESQREIRRRIHDVWTREYIRRICLELRKDEQ